MEKVMKNFTYSSYLKYLQFILLLAIVLFNFSPANISIVHATAAPPNDAWQNAIALTIPFSATVDTTGAQQETDEPQLGPVPTCNGEQLRAGLTTIWYKFTPTVLTAGLVSLDTLGSTQAVINTATGKPYEYDTYIAVWTSATNTMDSDASDGNPVLVACNDDNDAGYRSQLGFNAVAGTTYYIQVAQYNGRLNDIYIAQPYQGGTLKFHAGYGAQTSVYINGAFKKSYTVQSQQSTRDSYPTTNNGPVRLLSTNSVPIMGAERVIYNINGVNTSFTEMMALPNSQLNTIYWLPWYNNVDLDTQLRFANVSASAATVHVYINGVEMVGSPFTLGIGASTRQSFIGINNGPVKIVSDVNIVAAERVIYKINGVNTSFSEMMALPNSQLNTTYWLPWYNNVDLDTQLRFANVSGSTATVHVYVNGVEMVGSPFSLGVGASTRQSFVGINNGPVKIVSDVNIVAAERVIYKVNNVNTSFAEMMALPNSQLNTIYWLPWYNNVDLDTQLRFANVSGSTATVHVYINGVEMVGSPFTLAAGASTRQSFVGVNNGPVKIVSDVNIVAAERVIYKINGVNTSFSEMMALPNSSLDTSYWLPWYNNVDLDTQLRFAVP
jgi:hypothetical protein